MRSGMPEMKLEEACSENLLYRVFRETANPQVREALSAAVKRMESSPQAGKPDEADKEKVAALLREMTGEASPKPGGMTLEDFCQRLGIDPPSPKGGGMTVEEFTQKIYGGI